MSDDDNVFQPKFGQVKGGKEDDDTIPTNDYVVVDVDDNEWSAHGFLIFTPHHLAIMRDEGKGAIPVLVMPILRVKAAGLDGGKEDEPSLL